MKKLIGLGFGLFLALGVMLYPKEAQATCTVTTDRSSSGHSALRDCATHQGSCGATVIVTCPQ
jgi:hypothetical protein